MKRIIPLLLIVFAITSCQKDKPLDREKFIGNYTGTQTVTSYADGLIISSDTYTGTETVSEGYLDNEIIIGEGSDFELTAMVSGSQLIITSQPIYVQNSGTTVTMTAIGDGSITSNGVLTINATLTGNYLGHSLQINIVEIVSKN